MTRKFKRLGHVKEKKLVGWDLQKPRDNSMYNIGEGVLNLKKMDNYVKKRSGGSATSLFGTGIVNQLAMDKQRRRNLPKGNRS